MNAYLKLTGAKQGEIKGSITHHGVGGLIEVHGAHELVSVPTGPSAVVTGKRVWAPFTITKAVDRSTPQLYNALINHELLSVWELRFFSPIITATMGTGSELNDMIVRLGGASIVSIELTMPNNRIPELAKLPTSETIVFGFETFEIDWVDGGLVAKDSFGDVPQR